LKSTVKRIVRRIEEIGSVKNHPKTGRPPSVTNEEKKLNFTIIRRESSTSVRRIAQEREINPMSVHKILK